jgi:nucleosome assembly protein 1-like 1
LNHAKKLQYATKCQTVNARRASLIAGSSAPTLEEVKKGEASTSSSEGSSSTSSTLVAASIETFWLTALKNHKDIAKQITSRDEGALKYLKDIRLNYDVPGGICESFMLEFEFGANPYFEDTVLKKSYFYNVSFPRKYCCYCP